MAGVKQQRTMATTEGKGITMISKEIIEQLFDVFEEDIKSLMSVYGLSKKEAHTMMYALLQKHIKELQKERKNG